MNLLFEILQNEKLFAILRQRTHKVGIYESSNAQRYSEVFETFRLDDDFLVVASLDMSSAKRTDVVRSGDFENRVSIGFRNIECETCAHVEVAVRFRIIHRTVFLQKAEDRQLLWQLLDDVGE